MTHDKTPDFYGFLGRFRQNGSSVELRFYPFAFPTLPGEKSVFVVRFSDPEFSEADTSLILDDEVEVSVSSDRVEIYGVFSASETVLKAKSLSVDWEACDIEDYADRLEQLDAENAKLNQDLTAAIQKNEKGLAIVYELFRRAEIKSQASPDHRRQQHAAIEALKRLVAHFEGNE